MGPMSTMFAAVLCVAVCCMHAVDACGETLLKSNFNSHQGFWQHWNRAMAEGDFPEGLKYTKGIQRAEVGEGALRIKHPAGGVGAGETGMLMAVSLPRQVESATLSYRVKFEAGYDWTAGGKLPGLCDSECPVGCVNMDSDQMGWSSRIMFRQEGRAESYMYFPHMKDFGTCGLSWMTSASFVAGSWHDVKLYIKLNTGGKNNGEQKVWIDGQEVLSRNDIRFRPGSGNLIHQLKFENFHGGKSDQFKPSHTQHVSFDDITVQGGFCPDGRSNPAPFVEQPDDAGMPSVDGIKRKLGRPGGPPDSGAAAPSSPPPPPPQPPLPPNNDEEIDDDDGDTDPDCGDGGEPVCTWQQVRDHGRVWECDHGYHNDGHGTCVMWTAH